MMDRRKFGTTVLVGLAACRPALAQSRRDLPIVGLLFAGSEATAMNGAILPHWLAAMHEHGQVPGKTIRLETRFADGDLGQLPRLARELVALQLDVIYTVGTPGALAAVEAAEGRIPIVIGPAAQATMSTLVPNYGRPDRNITGLTLEGLEQDAKCIEHLKVCAPAATRFAILVNPDNQAFARFLEDMKGATRTLGIELFEAPARNASELQSLFHSDPMRRADALIASNDGTLLNELESRRSITAFALQQRLPSASTHQHYARDGGLISFGVAVEILARRAAYFVHRILQGMQPANLPVERPTRILLKVNSATARALGLTLPPAILLRADEVIE